MKKRLFIVFALTITALFSLGLTAGVAADKVYINGFDAAYPPFSFVDKNGKPSGFDIDSINWIAKEMGFKVKHRPTDWAFVTLIGRSFSCWLLRRIRN